MSAKTTQLSATAVPDPYDNVICFHGTNTPVAAPKSSGFPPLPRSVCDEYLKTGSCTRLLECGYVHPCDRKSTREQIKAKRTVKVCPDFETKTGCAPTCPHLHISEEDDGYN
jgi:hypothetical protein